MQSSLDYLPLTVDVNFKWNWRSDDPKPAFYVNPTTNIAALMKQQPQSRLLLAGGYYDLAVPLLGPRHATNQGGVPLDRVTFEAFQAGHSPFSGEANRARISNVMHAFLNASW